MAFSVAMHVFLALLLTACGSGMSATSDGGDASTSADANAVALQERVGAIFARSCALSSCHGGSLDAPFGIESIRFGPRVYARPSSQVPRLLRIAPGDPESSYMMIKIEGRMNQLPECAADPRRCGSRMPMIGGEGLPAEDVAAIREWIRTAP